MYKRVDHPYNGPDGSAPRQRRDSPVAHAHRCAVKLEKSDDSSSDRERRDRKQGIDHQSDAGAHQEEVRGI